MYAQNHNQMVLSGMVAQYGTAVAAPFHPTPDHGHMGLVQQNICTIPHLTAPFAFEFRRVVFSLPQVPPKKTTSKPNLTRQNIQTGDLHGNPGDPTKEATKGGKNSPLLRVAILGLLRTLPSTYSKYLNHPWSPSFA